MKLRTVLFNFQFVQKKFLEEILQDYRHQSLARISHKVPTAAAQRTMSTAFRSIGLLDILSSMPAVASIARLVSTALCTASLRNPVRKAG